MNDELNALRREIDGIDAELVTLLKRRMAAAAEIAALKGANGLPVLDSERERALLARIRKLAGEELSDGFGSIYSAILAASRSYQNALLGRENHEHEYNRGGKAMICGLLGGKLGHSYSPQIHAELGDYKYLLFERAPEELDAFFADRSWTGVNVTIPYKRAAMKYCDVISERALRIGCVNTVVREADGLVHGYNTDYDGFLGLVNRTGYIPRGKKALILGSGGASLTAQCVLGELGAEVVAVSRSGADNYENVYSHTDAALIVNATPVGMYPRNGERLVDLSRFPKLECVLDVVYNPARTQLLLDAEKLGVTAMSGLAMLVIQAAAAAERFTGGKPKNSVEVVLADIGRGMQNILLVGMPGSGKTTIGTALAERLGRRFFDMDDEIVKAEVTSIPEIFKRGGEEEFRAIEHRLLEKFSKESGAVIAAGGGAVTREENYDLLRQNSCVIWLQRDIAKLPTCGRPLSTGADLNEMYRVRRPMYQAVSDYTADNNGTVDETVESIIKATGARANP